MALIRLLLLIAFVAASGDVGSAIDPDGRSGASSSDTGSCIDPNGGCDATNGGGAMDPNG